MHILISIWLIVHSHEMSTYLLIYSDTHTWRICNNCPLYIFTFRIQCSAYVRLLILVFVFMFSALWAVCDRKIDRIDKTGNNLLAFLCGIEWGKVIDEQNLIKKQQQQNVHEWMRGEWTFYWNSVVGAVVGIFFFIQFHNWHRLWSSFFSSRYKSFNNWIFSCCRWLTSQTALQLVNWMENPT